MVTLLNDYEQQTYFLNSGDDIDGIVFRNGDQVFLMDQDVLIIYDEGGDNWYPVPTGGGGGGTGLQWTLIGEKTIALPEYTDTVNLETTDTEIDVKNADYAYILVVITCDTPILTATEWGMTVAIGGRYTSNSNFFQGVSLCQKGTATLSFAAMSAGTYSGASYGVNVPGNTASITFTRKCHATNCTSCRAGNYNVKVYGLASL